MADYIIAIAEALTLPVVAYIRSDAIGVKDLVRVATHANVAGVKFASHNMMLLSDCVRATAGTQATTRLRTNRQAPASLRNRPVKTSQKVRQ